MEKKHRIMRKKCLQRFFIIGIMSKRLKRLSWWVNRRTYYISINKSLEGNFPSNTCYKENSRMTWSYTGSSGFSYSQLPHASFLEPSPSLPGLRLTSTCIIFSYNSCSFVSLDGDHSHSLLLVPVARVFQPSRVLNEHFCKWVNEWTNLRSCPQWQCINSRRTVKGHTNLKEQINTHINEA